MIPFTLSTKGEPPDEITLNRSEGPWTIRMAKNLITTLGQVHINKAEQYIRDVKAVVRAAKGSDSQMLNDDLRRLNYGEEA